MVGTRCAGSVNLWRAKAVGGAERVWGAERAEIAPRRLRPFNVGRGAARPYRIVIGCVICRVVYATRGVIATGRQKTSSPPLAGASAIRG